VVEIGAVIGTVVERVAVGHLGGVRLADDRVVAIVNRAIDEIEMAALFVAAVNVAVGTGVDRW